MRGKGTFPLSRPKFSRCSHDDDDGVYVQDMVDMVMLGIKSWALSESSFEACCLIYRELGLASGSHAAHLRLTTGPTVVKISCSSSSVAL